MFELTGKRAFVTGAASGIGLAVAKAMKEQGAEVVIADIEGVERQPRVPIVGRLLATSVTRTAYVGPREAYDQLRTPLDIIVLNAGIGDVGDLLESTTVELMERVTKVEVFWGDARPETCARLHE